MTVLSLTGTLWVPRFRDNIFLSIICHMSVLFVTAILLLDKLLVGNVKVHWEVCNSYAAMCEGRKWEYYDRHHCRKIDLKLYVYKSMILRHTCTVCWQIFILKIYNKIKYCYYSWFWELTTNPHTNATAVESIGLVSILNTESGEDSFRGSTIYVLITRKKTTS